jgi:FSR family fosmidomycin resistance protein-like MFS transporter
MKEHIPSVRNKHLILQFNIAHFSHHVSTGALIPLLPILRQAFSLNYFQAGILVSAFSISLGFGQIPMAMLADRSSRRLVIGWGMTGIALAGIGLSLTTTFWQMVACIVAMGLFGSTYHASASSFISQALPPAQRGRALGYHVIGGSAAFLFTPVAALWLATVLRSWRSSFFILALPALVSGLLLWLGTEEIRRDKEKAQSAGGNPGTGTGDRATADKADDSTSWSGIVRAIGLLASVAMMMQLAVSSINSYLPLCMVDQHRVPPEWAGLVTAIVAGAGIIGAPLGGALSDRLGRKRVILAAILLSGPLLLAVAKAPYGIPLLLALICYGTVMVARMPLAESLIADHVPVGRRTTVLGIYLFVGQETGGVVTPIIGRFMDTYGSDAVLTSVGAGLCVIAVLAWLLRKYM